MQPWGKERLHAFDLQRVRNVLEMSRAMEM